MRYEWMAVVVSCALLGPPASGQLVNPSFEETGEQSACAGWSEQGNAENNILREEVEPLDGAAHLTMFGQDLVHPTTGQGLPSTTAVSQTLPAAPGQSWRASVWAMHPSADPLRALNQARIRLEFLNASMFPIWNTEIAILSSASPTDLYINRTMTPIAPGNTAHVRLLVIFENCACPTRDGIAYYDLAALERERPADLDNDGSVGFADLSQFLARWGTCPAAPAACFEDFDGDGFVGFSDLTDLLADWG